MLVIYGNLYHINKVELSNKISQYHTILNQLGYFLPQTNGDILVTILRQLVIKK